MYYTMYSVLHFVLVMEGYRYSYLITGTTSITIAYHTIFQRRNVYHTIFQEGNVYHDSSTVCVQHSPLYIYIFLCEIQLVGAGLLIWSFDICPQTLCERYNI